MIEHLRKFNLARWINEDRSPSETKRQVWGDSDFWAFVVWGPNDRKVFHVNPGDELFQQLEGTLALHYMPPGRREPRVEILEPGDLFLLSAGVPHSPRREAGSSTLVITPRRAPDAEERWLWFCERCHATLHEVGVTGRRMEEPVEALTRAASALKEDEALRTCRQCGHCSSP